MWNRVRGGVEWSCLHRGTPCIATRPPRPTHSESEDHHEYTLGELVSKQRKIIRTYAVLGLKFWYNLHILARQNLSEVCSRRSSASPCDAILSMGEERSNIISRFCPGPTNPPPLFTPLSHSGQPPPLSKAFSTHRLIHPLSYAF